MSENLPQFVNERIDLIQRKSGINKAEIVKDYIRYFEDPYVQEDKSFSGDEARHKYTAMILWNSYINRPPVKLVNIIIAGLGGVRTTRAGKKQGEAFTLFKYKDGYRPRRIVFQEDIVDVLKELVPLAAYKTKLGEFSAGGDYVADNRSIFDTPINTNLTAEKVLQMIRAERVPKLSDTKNYPSKINAAGYVDSSDWKIVSGLVYSSYRGPRKNDPDSEMGVYNIIDFSLSRETTVSEDGRASRPGFTCWCAPELVIYEDESELEFAGPISLSKTGEASMNIYLINPIHARLRAED